MSTRAVRYLFRDSEGNLFGLSPVLWDRPDMDADTARATLESVYGFKRGALSLVRVES
jgi:hypothetical protein